MSINTPITAAVLARAKWAFSTRRVPHERACLLDGRLSNAVSGDLVLGRIQSLGSHKRIQLAQGRVSELYLDDLVVLGCGDRYASDQFEGIAEIDPRGADMLAGGGVIGRMRERNARMSAPTRITPLGLLCDADGAVINVADHALAPAPRPDGMTVVGVVGAAMNSGKTTAAAAFAHGLTRAGHEVAALKATGTGAFGDFNAYLDAGVRHVADFTDVGMIATYRQPLARIESGLDTLLADAAARGAEIAVVELADGVFQKETAALLRNLDVRSAFTGFVFAAPDALAAAGGCAALRGMGIEPAILTGMLSRSPLGVREAEEATGVRVITREALCDPAQANALMARMVAAARRPAAVGDIGLAA